MGADHDVLEAPLLGRGEIRVEPLQLGIGEKALAIAPTERRVVFDLVNVVRGEASIKQALVRDKKLNNLYLLPASQTRDKDALTEEGVEAVITELRGYFDYVICDSPAGIEIPGRPARLAGTVKTSLRYMATGSSILSPMPKAALGAVGVSTTSTFS